MTITLALYAAIYAGAFVFVAACVSRAWIYARQPPHLRWELYPVPHERPDRVAHGGSYYEDGNWWTRPRRRHLLGELRFMVPEMVFLKGLWDWNRSLWYRSFAFHFGLYLLAGAAGTLLLAALITLAPAMQGGGVETVARALYRTLGVAGWVLTVAGALALLHRRMTDRALRIYSVPADLFNLAFFVVTLAVLAAGYATAAGAFPGALGFTRALVRFDTGVHVPLLLAAGLALASLLLAYIPLTHMSHFIAKYFTYHAIRWDDAPVADGRALARRIAACLATRPTWAAPHVGADGTKTWLDIAVANPAEGAKK